MRRLVVSVLTSLDGYFQATGGDLSRMPFEDAFNTHNLELLERAGTLVYGGTWFPENWAHWSAVAADPTQSDRDHRIAALVTSLDVLIISDSLTIEPGDPWAATARVVPRAEGPAEIEELKAGDGGDLLMFGSATTWSPLMEAGLVDELVILIGAAMLGDGVKVYSGAPAGLRLRDAEILPGSQLVRLRYRAGSAGEQEHG